MESGYFEDRADRICPGGLDMGDGRLSVKEDSKFIGLSC